MRGFRLQAEEQSRCVASAFRRKNKVVRGFRLQAEDISAEEDHMKIADVRTRRPPPDQIIERREEVIGVVTGERA